MKERHRSTTLDNDTRLQSNSMMVDLLLEVGQGGNRMLMVQHIFLMRCPHDP